VEWAKGVPVLANQYKYAVMWTKSNIRRCWGIGKDTWVRRQLEVRNVSWCLWYARLAEWEITDKGSYGWMGGYGWTRNDCWRTMSKDETGINEMDRETAWYAKLEGWVGSYGWREVMDEGKLRMKGKLRINGGYVWKGSCGWIGSCFWRTMSKDGTEIDELDRETEMSEVLMWG